MKIRALEIEEDGRVYRYSGSMQLESQWEDVGEKKVVEGNRSTTDVVGGTCECGHLEWEHIPACLYIPQGCKCDGYRAAENK